VKLFGFEPLAAPRQYFGVSFETQLLGVRMEQLADNVKDRKIMRRAWLNALDYLRDALACDLRHAAPAV
jgi:hypothetical protein